MLILAKLSGLLIIGLGVTFFIKTDFLKKYVSFLSQAKKYYGIGIIRIAIGIILILAAREAVQGVVAAVLGSLMLISGALVFAIGEGKMQSLLAWYADLPDLAIRILGLVAVVFGLLIILSL